MGRAKRNLQFPDVVATGELPPNKHDRRPLSYTVLAILVLGAENSWIHESQAWLSMRWIWDVSYSAAPILPRGGYTLERQTGTKMPQMVQNYHLAVPSLLSLFFSVRDGLRQCVLVLNYCYQMALSNRCSQ